MLIPANRFRAVATENPDEGIIRLGTVKVKKRQRLPTGFSDLDISLGGGFARPSVIQFAGEPGIGKSSLLLQVVNQRPMKSLYVTSEETVDSLAERAQRMVLPNLKDIGVLMAVNPDEIKDRIVSSKAELVIIDSLQGLRVTADAEDQLKDSKQKRRKHTQLVVRDIALDLIYFAQKKEEYEHRIGDPVAFIMVSHVNKMGDLAGLKEIEHMVDVVAWFGGERGGKNRHFRLDKNRFGPTDKRAKFTMESDGLHEVIEDNQPVVHDRPVADGPKPVKTGVRRKPV